MCWLAFMAILGYKSLWATEWIQLVILKFLNVSASFDPKPPYI